MLAVLARRRAKLLARSSSQLASTEGQATSQLARQRLDASRVKERLGKRNYITKLRRFRQGPKV